jgi:hypothetical protein
MDIFEYCIDPQYCKIFEGLVANQIRCNRLRQCRSMEVSEKLELTPCGEYRLLFTDGGGDYCQWYYYHTLDGNHMLIFRTPYGDNFRFSGRKIDKVPTSFGL